mgnify:CR=1 FL=1
MGGEALARWQHPDKGFLSPGYFIPLMERENMIERMDYYILDKSCAFLDRLNRQGIHDFFLSCNFSRKSFAPRTSRTDAERSWSGTHLRGNC